MPGTTARRAAVGCVHHKTVEGNRSPHQGNRTGTIETTRPNGYKNGRSRKEAPIVNDAIGNDRSS
ncbi:MAG: hypothetical protein ACI9R3_003795 [Verrucomicrobiales bacterium]|jgi:hypothetical protein